MFQSIGNRWLASKFSIDIATLSLSQKSSISIFFLTQLPSFAYVFLRSLTFENISHNFTKKIEYNI